MAAGDGCDIRFNVIVIAYSFSVRTKEVPLTNELAAGLQTTTALPVHPWSVQCGCSRAQSGRAQIFGGRFTPTVRDDIECHGLTLVKGSHAGTLNRADMDEDILPTLCWLNKSKTFLTVEPLHNSLFTTLSFLTVRT